MVYTRGPIYPGGVYTGGIIPGGYIEGGGRNARKLGEMEMMKKRRHHFCTRVFTHLRYN
jgi:hypothetical protein